MESEKMLLMKTLLLLLYFVKNGSSTRMVCPILSVRSSHADLVMDWNCALLDYRNTLADWKRVLERECNLRNKNYEWTSIFRCPDFSDVRCVDESERVYEWDSFSCYLTFCADGRYRDQSVLRRISREYLVAHKDIMAFYKTLGSCGKERRCEDSTTARPDTHTTASADWYESSTTASSATTITTAKSPTQNPTTASTTVSSLPVLISDDCKYTLDGGCYWIEIRDNWSVNFTEAQSICGEYGSVLAVIPDELTHYALTDYIVANNSYVELWLGMTINTTTKEVFPEDSFHELWWSATGPDMFLTNDSGHLYLAASPTEDMYGLSFRGLRPGKPSEGTNGAVCWKPNNVSCVANSSGACYWIELQDRDTVDFYEASVMCDERESVLAVIPDEQIYHAIVDALENMTSHAEVWLGMTIDPASLSVSPPESFSKYWWSTAPYSHSSLTKITLTASHSWESAGNEQVVFEGYKNTDPAYETDGVVCCTPRESCLHANHAIETTTAKSPTQNPTTASATVSSLPILISDDCKYTLDGGCYWVEIRDSWSVNFTEAETICGEFGSVLAVIPDELTHYALTDYIVADNSFISLWLGMTINTTTKEVFPKDSFHEIWWSAAGPGMYLTNDSGHLYLQVNPSQDSWGLSFRGLMPGKPSRSTNGAVCWKPKNVSCVTNSSGACYWIELQDRDTVDFYEASVLCGERESVLAVIPDEEIYHAIVDALENMTSHAEVWLGMTIDPASLSVSPPGSFSKYWWSTSPYSDSSLTKITLTASHNWESAGNGQVVFEGYKNTDPAYETDGVVCCTPRESCLHANHAIETTTAG